MDETQQPIEARSLPFQGPHATVDDRQRDTPFVPLRLVLRPGGNAVELTRPDVVLGRHSDADIRLALPDVSRRHCRFVFADKRWQIFDLNSLNGIFVNGDQVKQATIDAGDYIRIGGFVFEAEIGRPVGEKDAEPVSGSVTHAQVLRSIAEALPLPGQDSFPQRKAS